MKLRTLFFDFSVLKKNIIRFAPVWGLYSAYLLVAFLLMDSPDRSPLNADVLASAIAGNSAMNFIYALAAALMLWGDLYNSRMCNALHALPLRRECWFVTGTVSGLLFSLVPNTVFALAMVPMCGQLWPVAALWLGSNMMQYLCFFGLATLSAFLVGSRFGLGLVHGIVNFLSLILYALLETLYLPEMEGIVLRDEHFTVFAPLVKMIDNYEILQVDWEFIRETNSYSHASWSIGEGWGYLGIWAGVGAVALALALLLYRKRHLECAGDLVAVKPLAPVVLGIYTLCAAMVTSVLFGYSDTIFTFIGLVVGFFTGKMLLERQVRVFRKKNFLVFAAVVLVFYGSMAAAAWDVLGIVKWVPKAENVASVSLSTGGSYYYQENGITLEDAQDIEKVLALHQEGLEGTDADYRVRMQLTYTMKSGIRRSRAYNISIRSEGGKALKTYLSSPEAVLEEPGLPENFVAAEFHDPGIEITDAAALVQLREAILADCEAGNIAQDWGFYPGADEVNYMTLEYKTADGISYRRELRFWEGCENIMAWIEDQGIVFEKYVPTDIAPGN